MEATPTIWIPRYACPKRPNGIVPPSPPAETRERNWREFLRDHVSYRGSLEAPVNGVSRVIRPRLNLGDLTRVFMRGLGGMTGMVGEGGTIDAAFGPMGSANPIPTLAADARFYYKLNTTGWLDSAATASNLTSHGGVTSVAGQFGNCANFVSASSQFLDHAHASAFDFSGTSFSIYGWVYTHLHGGSGSGNAYGWFTQSGGGGSNDWGLRLSEVNTERASFWYTQKAGPTGSKENTTTLSLDTWYFVCVTLTYNAAADCPFHVILNTSDQSFSGAISNGINNTAGYTFNVGQTAGNTFSRLDGRVEAVGGNPRVITAGEISSLWNSGNGQYVFA